MPVYPYYGSIKKIDGILVVKFSDQVEFSGEPSE